jgi:hypothetical protein
MGLFASTVWIHGGAGLWPLRSLLSIPFDGGAIDESLFTAVSRRGDSAEFVAIELDVEAPVD